MELTVIMSQKEYDNIQNTIKDLKEDNIICYKGKQFCCEECLEEYKRAHKKSVDIPIHIDDSIVR